MNLFRKTLFLISGTVTGVVGVLAYNPPHISNALASSSALPTGTTPTQNTSQPTAQATTQSSSQPTQQTKEQSPTQPQSKQTTPPKKTSAPQTSTESSSTQSSSPAPAAAPASDKSGTFKGDVARTHYGPVQVQITVANGKITDVQALSYPDGDGRSQYISSVMIPWLTQETLKVQSTNIMNVSGATITGNAWKYSLASAMQQAGL